MQERQIGAAMAEKSPLALGVTCVILLTLFMTSAVNYMTLGYAIGFGVLTSLLLLAYWHGKGGSFFILALLMPMGLVVMAELPNFMALAWLVNGFFFGAALLLFIYGKITK